MRPYDKYGTYTRTTINTNDRSIVLLLLQCNGGMKRHIVEGQRGASIWRIACEKLKRVSLNLPCTVENTYGILESNENEYDLAVKEGNNMLTIVKIVISGIIVGAVNLVARYNPTLGGWLAAMPLCFVR